MPSLRLPPWLRLFPFGKAPEIEFEEAQATVVYKAAAQLALFLAPLFFVLSLTAGAGGLAALYAFGFVNNLLGLFLLRAGKLRLGILLMFFFGMGRMFLSGYLYNNGSEFSLLLNITTVLILPRMRSLRHVIALVAGGGFLAVEIHRYLHPAPPVVPVWQAALTIVVFLVVLSWQNAAFRAMHQASRLQAVEQRRQLAEQHARLEERTRDLAEANAFRERLFSVVASLRGTLRQAADGTLAPDAFHEICGLLSGEADLLHQNLENLMEWGGGQMKAIRARPAPSSLRAAAEEARELLDGIATGKGGAVENEVPGAALVHADPHHLRSIVRNPLSNAVNFTPAGGRVTLSAALRDGAWQASVRDTGIGMEPKRAARLLEDGQPESTPGTGNERGLGLGLGLHLCREFLRGHGGALSVESAPGRGTTFRFTPPAARPDEIAA